MSYATGTTVELPWNTSLWEVAPESVDVFWVTGKTGDDGWVYGHHSTAKGLKLHPVSERPYRPVAMHGMLWAQTETCALLRMDPYGEANCVDKTRPDFLGVVRRMSDSHVRYPTQNGRWVLRDVRASREVDLGCPDPDLRSHVRDPFAVVVQCPNGATLWSETGSMPAEPTYPLRGWPTHQSERFVPVTAGHFYDAKTGEVVRADAPLHLVTKDGVGGGVDLKTMTRTKLAYPECPWFEGLVSHRRGQWEWVTCSIPTSEQEADRSRRGAERLDSCRTPLPPPHRLHAQWLLDHRAGVVHRISGMKVVGLTDHGVIGLQGSGHDMDDKDGVRLVLQPYPQSDLQSADREPFEITKLTNRPVVVSKQTYRQAYYELLCIYDRLADDPGQSDAFAQLGPRHGLPDGPSTQFALKLNPAEMFEIQRRAKTCTVEEALGFGRTTQKAK